MSKLLGAIFGGGAKELISEAGKVVDNVVTTVEERGKLKEQLTEVVMRHLAELQKLQAAAIMTEMEGSKLQRNWRPIVMLVFTWVIFYRYFLAPVTGWPAIDMPERFWSLLEVGLGGYVIGRTVEKVADKVTANVDMPFLKRKGRRVDE